MPLKIKNLLTILFISFFVSAAVAQETRKKVLISQVVEHPALNATVKGIIDGLEQNGYKSGKNLDIRFESAQGSIALASQIAAKFINQNPDMVVGVGTLSAQSFLKYARENRIKFVFSSVTDPSAAGLVLSSDKVDSQISGVSNFVALEPQIQLFQSLQPDLKRLGILYNPGELNSVAIVKRLEELSAKLGIILIKQTAAKTADVAQSALLLASKVDAIFISNDNTALSALRSVVMAANKAKIPVYVSDTDALTLGALAALGPNQYQIGLQTGRMIARALNGADISAMPIEFPMKTDLYINEEVAQNLNIKIPAHIKNQATKFIQRKL